jgi:hypothetical protein
MKIILPLTLVLALASCTGNSTAAKKADTAPKKDTVKAVQKAKPAAEKMPEDAKLTAFCRFIAGMGDTLAFKANRTGAWRSFSAQNNGKWQQLQTRVGKPIETWVKGAGLEVANEPKTLFYPFAGGDFYYAHSFFPKQDTIIMIGLEPGGSIYNPDTVGAATLADYYSSLQHSMFFPHRLGFFRTKSMAVDFNKSILNGTMHTVLFYLARFRASVHYISHFDLDKNGGEINTIAAAAMKKGQKKTAYRVGYSLPGDSAVREVIYLSYDASNGNLSARPNLMNWLNNRGNVVTFFKAASYLMHYSSFTSMREFVSKHTVRLLQDDSGLPYDYMLKNNFEVKLLGQYSKTISLFKNEFQPSLKAAYEKAKPEKLPFNIGYNAEFGECNLQWAKKK